MRKINFHHKNYKIDIKTEKISITVETMKELLLEHKPKEIFLSDWSERKPFYVISEYLEDGIIAYCDGFADKTPQKYPYEWIHTNSQYSGFESCYFFVEGEEPEPELTRFKEDAPLHLYQGKPVLTGNWLPGYQGEKILIAVDSDTKQSRVAIYYPSYKDCTKSEAYWLPTKDMRIILKPIEALTAEEKRELYVIGQMRYPAGAEAMNMNQLDATQIAKLLEWGYDLKLLPRWNYVLTTELETEQIK